jgi:HSP90 family molecular chaperone
MSISSLSSASSLSVISVTSSATSSSSVTSAGDSTEMSEVAKLMKELGDLQKSDPAKFKEATAEIAQKLKDAASKTTGGQADLLNGLANKFDQASQTGSMSALQPPAAPGQHGGHHHVHKYSAQQETDATSAPQQSVDVAQILQSAINDAE